MDIVALLLITAIIAGWGFWLVARASSEPNPSCDNKPGYKA